MKKAILLAVVATCACANVVFAQGISYIATLTGAQDGGGARSGSGLFTLTLSPTNTLTISGSFSGLSANSTAAHIHGPSAPFPSSTNVIYDFTPNGLNLATLGGTSGTINGSFDLLPKSSGNYTVAQQIADLNNQLWYVNVHSTAFPGGEIRGVILAVPEPSTSALAGIGALALGWAVRRRK